MLGSSVRHWHVTLTVGGDPVEPILLRAGLKRLSEERPFLDSMRFSPESVELQYWDQGEAMVDVASLAMRLWNDHRATAGLPHWEVVGLEVVEKALQRGARPGTPATGPLTLTPPHT